MSEKSTKSTTSPGSPSAKFKKRSLFDRTNFLGRVWFCYVYPLFLKGWRQDGLNIEDLYQCPVDDKSEKLMHRIARYWQCEQQKKRPRFWWSLFCAFIPYVIIPICILLFIECFLNIVQPFLLGQVILYFSGEPTITYGMACLYAAGICGTTIANIILVHPTMTHMARIGMRIRVACCTLMYQKSLKLSRASLGQTAVGQIINIMSNDAMRFDEFGFFSTYLVTGPLQTVIVIYFLWVYLGLSCIAGLIILFLFIPFQSIMGRLFSRIRLSTAILTDSRLRFMNEIISGMRVIKMYSWEHPFAERVSDARKAEVSKIRKTCYLKAINLSVFFVASRVILFVSFVVYVLLGNVLTSEAVFVTMSLMNTLRLTMTLFFPHAIGYGAELKITCSRMQTFLELEEMQQSQANECRTNQNEAAHLSVQNITANWIHKSSHPTLSNISVDLAPGELLAVIGPVGSGKSSFLMSLLKELPVESGKIDQVGTVSYASQDAWSFNDSVRNNILFGADYDHVRYKKVVEVCALQRDLTLMPFGDRTLVGEKGVSLSGGQKARINLARAVYRDSDIFLLDDPLSAVDAAVAEHIFEQCIMDHLKAKIRVLVTHQIQFIEKATKILILKEGGCLAYGSYEEIQQLGIDFVSLLATDHAAEAAQQKQDDNPAHNLNRGQSISMMSMESSLASLHGGGRATTPLLHLDSIEAHERTGTLTKDEEKIRKDEEEQLLVKVEEEQYSRGSIQARIYFAYFKAGSGPLLLTAMIVLTILSQAIFNGSDIFLTLWTNKNQIGEVDRSEQTFDIIVYSALIGGLFVSTILRSISFFAICMRASVQLHNKIFTRLLRAPLAFFDTNPAGRILNRFTKDLGIIDEMLPYVAYDLNLIGLQALGIIATVAFVNWYLVFPAIVLAFFVVIVRGIYIKSARDIKRYEGLTRSPVYSHVSTTINGLASIRAYGAQRTFERQFFTYQNDHTATWFLFISSSRAMGLIVDWICILFNIIIIGSVMLMKDIPGGNAGLAISCGLGLAGMSQWGVRQSAEFESQMTSVERIVQYQDLEQEAQADSPKDKKPDDKWPSSGQIEFDHMSLAYGGNYEQPVLKDINATIYGGEKIGIVGRTGAGKSSIIAALFRLTEPRGAIRLDGVNIQSIGLDDLRKAISIIPQDPVVFTGTVRYNLDPFGEYPDTELWSALEEVQLKAQVDKFCGQLDAKLSESGSNLSVGQRQLICLARAILRRNRVLILDEATANVDHQTDRLIQKTIRTEFSACTVLTIAHRLNTIIDCDRVLVLDAGEIQEFDSPYQLLKRRAQFYEMCKKTGPAMYSHLYQLAKRTAVARRRRNTWPYTNTPIDGILPDEILLEEEINNNNINNNNNSIIDEIKAQTNTDELNEMDTPDLYIDFDDVQQHPHTEIHNHPKL